MINRVVLVGRLTRDPELKYTTNGIANMRFSIAVTRTYTAQNGEKQADFINCVAWRNQAENMAKFLHKGALIGVEGRIETGSYKSQDGSTKYTTDVICESVQFLEPKKSGQQSSHHQEAGFTPQSNFDTPPFGVNPFNQAFSTPPQDYVPGRNETQININDDDLPF